ncbi:MAG: HD domain-containing protein, partial [bacterium]|nr:HD domain-containing protein [bacterium]
LGFAIEPVTWNALKKQIRHVNDERNGERVVPYEIIAKELLKSFLAQPVQAFDIWSESGAIKMLLPELLAMQGCPQPKQYHREGDVWTHTRLALAVLKRPVFKKIHGAPNAETVLAVLFHDIAKPKTITRPKKPGERIRFDGHDAVGADMTRRIAERLRLSSYKEKLIDVDAERLGNLVRYHLLPMSGDPRTMRATTIERHYLRDELFGRELLALHYADGSAAINANGRPGLSGYRAMKKRITALLGKKKTALPPPLLDGHEIMKALNMKPGPKVGALMEQLREAQLQGKIKTKNEAKIYLKKTAPSEHKK